jgi:hypothetical protein
MTALGYSLSSDNSGEAVRCKESLIMVVVKVLCIGRISVINHSYYVVISVCLPRYLLLSQVHLHCLQVKELE